MIFQQLRVSIINQLFDSSLGQCSSL